jgi:hypothetical protein
MTCLPSQPRISGSAAIACVLILIATAGSAAAQCSYMPLTSGVSQPVSATPSFFTILPPSPSWWTVVAVRPAENEDWDLAISSTTAAPPTCVGTSLSTSERGSGEADVIAGDFAGTSGSTHYLRTWRYGGGSQPAHIEWEHPGLATTLFTNGPPVTAEPGPEDVLQVWNAWLANGMSYTVELTAEGTASLRLLVFENGTGGAVWRNRVSAAFSMAPGTQTYTPSVSGAHAFAVVNDDGGVCRYGLSIRICSPPSVLTSGVGWPTDDYAHSYYRFSQAEQAWAAIGVQTTAAHADLGVFATGSGSGTPTCFSDHRAEVTFGGPRTGFLMCNFHAGGAPLGTYYAYVYLYPSSPPGTVLWADGALSVAYDGPPWSGYLENGAPLQVRDVYLAAGTTYTFSFSHADDRDFRLLLFRPGATASPWMTDGQQEFATTGTETYTAPVSGLYGLLVISDLGQSGPFKVGVSTCPPALALSDSSPFFVLDNLMRFRFNQQQPYWAAIAVRPVQLTYNWDLYGYTDPSGGAPPLCFNPLFVRSDWAAGFVDFVVADFNHIALGEQYAIISLAVPGTSQVYTEWEQGGTQMVVGDPPVTVQSWSSDIVKIWDVYLTPGNYAIYFQRLQGAGTHFFLFRNPGGHYWAGRGEQILSGSATTSFMTSVADYYGLVVVKESGADESYIIGVQPRGVDADAPGPRVTALRGVRPNPSRGEVTVEFDLAAGAAVEFELVDVAGRIVARSDPRAWEAGRWSTTWDLSGSARPGAGVYFLRMCAGGRVIGTRRLVVLM